ncbi:MAG: Ca-activated chloride channel family protein [Pirellulaceae bacterium]|jgi:Ca-activated chloride channel family protein
MAVVLIVALGVFLMMAVLAINVAYMELVKAELQVSTDMATRAASRTLSLDGDQDAAIEKARELAGLNTVAGTIVELAESDIEFGRAERNIDTGKYSYIADSISPNAVRIVGNRSTGNALGAVKLFMTVRRFEPAQPSTAAQINRDIVLVLDRSGSMVLMTDGIQFTSASGVPPLEAAETAALQKVTLHAIAYGRGADTQSMEEIAEIGYGSYWYAPQKRELEVIFDRIADSAPTLMTE